MTEQSQKAPTQESDALARITADFGGRRKLLDRRLRPTGDNDPNRRSGKERRCGFDRRSALNQTTEYSDAERRSTETK